MATASEIWRSVCGNLDWDSKGVPLTLEQIEKRFQNLDYVLNPPKAKIINDKAYPVNANGKPIPAPPAKQSTKPKRKKKKRA